MPITPSDAWYVQCIKIWYEQRFRHQRIKEASETIMQDVTAAVVDS